jgi:hypothetical protein
MSECAERDNIRAVSCDGFPAVLVQPARAVCVRCVRCGGYKVPTVYVGGRGASAAEGLPRVNERVKIIDPQKWHHIWDFGQNKVFVKNYVAAEWV